MNTFWLFLDRFFCLKCPVPLLQRIVLELRNVLSPFPFSSLLFFFYFMKEQHKMWPFFSLFELTIRKLLWVWRDQPIPAPVKCFLVDFSCSRKWPSGLPQAGMPVLSDHSQPQDPKLLPNVYYIGCAFLQIPFTFCCDCPKAFL